MALRMLGPGGVECCHSVGPHMSIQYPEILTLWFPRAPFSSLVPPSDPIFSHFSSSATGVSEGSCPGPILFSRPYCFSPPFIPVSLSPAQFPPVAAHPVSLPRCHRCLSASVPRLDSLSHKPARPAQQQGALSPAQLGTHSLITSIPSHNGSFTQPWDR